MIKNKSGSIINILQCHQTHLYQGICISKIRHINDKKFREMGQFDVRVNALRPGFFPLNEY